MVIMGLGFTEHEASVALVIDGRPVVAIALERVTRYKKDGTLFGRQRLSLEPAIDYCFKSSGLTAADLDLIVWNHFGHLTEAEVVSRLELEGSAGFGKTPNLAIPHHFAHACTSFYLSPWPDAAVLVADGTGGPWGNLPVNCEGPEPAALSAQGVLVQNLLCGYPDTVSAKPDEARELESFYAFEDGSWRVLRKILGEYGGVGGRYGAVSSVLFDNPFDAGKTMGLAPYGAARKSSDWHFLEKVDSPEAFRAVRDHSWKLAKQKIRLWRKGSALRNLALDYTDPVPATCAAAIQEEAERALVEYARWLRRHTSSLNLCLGGGVALNCVANSKIALEAGFEHVFVPPAPGDDGIAIGCALFGAALHGELRRDSCPVYLGHAYPAADAELSAMGLLPVGPGATPDWIAAGIAAGAVVARFEAGAELGPRALGHRSLLADPRNPHMRDHLNLVVKNRESFRPFAPVVLETAVAEFFEELLPSYFMSFVATVRAEKQAFLPAITHVDGTSRYQTLRQTDDAGLYELVSAFGRLTGIPMLLNTSFNRAGEPIVETPAQAAACVLAGSIDFLLIDGKCWANPRPPRPVWRQPLPVLPANPLPGIEE